MEFPKHTCKPVKGTKYVYCAKCKKVLVTLQ